MNQSKLKLLQETGWQSWSTRVQGGLKFPLFNFRPAHKKSYYNFPFTLGKKFKKPSYGWCSWYAYGPDINEKNIMSNANWMAKNKMKGKLPLDYVLIDAGWSVSGDWMSEDRSRFKKGLRKTAERIKALGLKPGIWMSPFLVHPTSKTATNHKDWLVKNNGKLVDGFRVTSWDYFLPHKKWIPDIRNPKVVKYLEDSIGYLIEECGFELLKLDFLYSIYFDPRLDGEETDKFLRNFLLNIKRKYPKVYTIACGCPLAPAINAVDSMRIGPDSIIDPFVKFVLPPFVSRRHINKFVIPTIAKRIWTKEFWNVDPDAFVCRSSLGLPESQLLKFRNIIKAAKGNIFLGDELTSLPEDRIEKYIYPLFG